MLSNTETDNDLQTNTDFTEVYENNIFGNSESRSGRGSTLIQTESLRNILAIILKKIKAKSLLDIPCGDYNWMQHVKTDNINYIGADIVKNLLISNSKYSSKNVHFVECDIRSDPLPVADVIFCRDCLVHLNTHDIHLALQNIAKSKAKYVILTTFPSIKKNIELIHPHIWRPLNMSIAPFNLKNEISTINEDCRQKDGFYADKSIGIWRIDSFYHYRA